MTGLLLTDKPAGPTSHDVVDRVRSVFKEKKSGHAGTLDPQATGLLVIALGDATRWLPYLGSDKRYVARVRFGLETDTEDVWGRELRRSDASGADEASIRGALESLQGKTSQVPPMVSALKHEGRRLYEYAREGLSVERKARPMEIHSLTLRSVRAGGAEPEAEFEVHCGSGTYVRSLCAEAGRILGTGACMADLRRTAVGPFRVEDATPWEGLEARASLGQAALLGAEEALAHLKEYKVPPAAERFLGNGRDFDLAPGDYDEAETWRLSSQDGRLLALANPKRAEGGWRMHPSRVFARP